jgi:hypothetical protein
LHSQPWGQILIKSVNDGCGPPVFKICGQVHHRVGSLLPPDDGPKIVQLYIYDTTNEINNQLRCLSGDDAPNGSLEPSIAHQLMKMLDQCNLFVKKI